ncbi:hypothetical protein NX059_010420 [Plenodomus lindquistii]|nr:hypothetical protein NX059_010420 [Plenodomus lindquistii]
MITTFWNLVVVPALNQHVALDLAILAHTTASEDTTVQIEGILLTTKIAKMGKVTKKLGKDRADVTREHSRRFEASHREFKAEPLPRLVWNNVLQQNTHRIDSRARCKELATQAAQRFSKPHAEIILSNADEAVRSDLERISDIQATLSLEFDQVLLYWSDGSYRSGFLGAGVATCVRHHDDVKNFSSEYALGFETGDNEDAELFAIAAALGLAKCDIEREDDSKIELVRVFSDSQSALLALKCRNNRRFGPLLAPKTALEGVYERCKWLHDRGVPVELQWVKGHASSLGNKLADKVAGQVVKDQIKADVDAQDLPIRNPKRREYTASDVPCTIQELGQAWTDEWLWRVNRSFLAEQARELKLIAIRENHAHVQYGPKNGFCEEVLVAGERDVLEEEVTKSSAMGVKQNRRARPYRP